MNPDPPHRTSESERAERIAAQADREAQKPVIVTVLAIICIGYGLLGMCMNGMYALTPLLGVGVEALTTKIQEEVAKETAAKEASFDEQVAAAETQEEREDIEASRAAWRARPKPDVEEMLAVYSWMGKPSAMAYFIGDAVISFAGNLAFIIAGIGMLRWRPWARRLALWVAVYKLAMGVALAIWYGVGVVPGMMEAMERMLEAQQRQMQQLGGGGAPPVGPPIAMMRTMTWVSTVFGAVMTLVWTSILPIVLLIALTRPKIRATFDPPGEVFD